MQQVSRTLSILSVLMLGACGGAEAPQDAGPTTAGAQADLYVGSGVIQEIRDGQLVIAHGDIPGLMGPMTMGYAVAADVDIEQFAACDTVTFELELPGPNEYLIIRVEETESEAPQ